MSAEDSAKGLVSTDASGISLRMIRDYDATADQWPTHVDVEAWRLVAQHLAAETSPRGAQAAGGASLCEWPNCTWEAICKFDGKRVCAAHFAVANEERWNATESEAAAGASGEASPVLSVNPSDLLHLTLQEAVGLANYLESHARDIQHDINDFGDLAPFLARMRP